MYSFTKNPDNERNIKIGLDVTFTIFMISVGLKHWVYCMKLWRLAYTLKQMVEGEDHKSVLIQYEVQIYYSVIIISFVIPIIFGII